MLVSLILFFIAGGFAGTLAGLLGVGGGMIIVPALNFIFTHYTHIPSNIVMHVASGTSLCVMIFTSLFSLLGHYKHGDILWERYKKMFLFIAGGTVIGAIFADMVPTFVMKKLFGFFLLVVSLNMYLTRKNSRHYFKPPDWVSRLVGTGIGLLSGFLGIGGGTIMIPYLSRCRVRVRRIAAISSLCTLTVAVVGTCAVIRTGWDDNPIHWSSGYVYWPAVLLAGIPSTLFARLAAKWTYRLPIHLLKILFIILLLITGVLMLV
jgi:hypothetical protein